MSHLHCLHDCAGIAIFSYVALACDLCWELARFCYWRGGERSETSGACTFFPLHMVPLLAACGACLAYLSYATSGLPPLPLPLPLPLPPSTDSGTHEPGTHEPGLLDVLGGWLRFAVLRRLCVRAAFAGDGGREAAQQVVQQEQQQQQQVGGEQVGEDRMQWLMSRAQCKSFVKHLPMLMPWCLFCSLYLNWACDQSKSGFGDGMLGFDHLPMPEVVVTLATLRFAMYQFEPAAVGSRRGDGTLVQLQAQAQV